METWTLAHEPQLRLGFFLGIFAVMAAWEVIRPARPRTVSKALRWASNLGIVVLNSVLLRLVFPVAAVGLATLAAERSWGLFHLVDWPVWLEVVLAAVLLDLIIYLQHALFHAVPGLWRLHRVHHADLDYDVTTGARFHPVEILLSMLIKLAAVAALGPAPVAVILFEVVLNGAAMFNHSNVRLPLRLDAVLRLVLVTPDMHRVHHSVLPQEAHRNFGFNLPWWDRLFGTYVAQPSLGHEGMQIGTPGVEDPKEAARLDGMLLLPFKKPRAVRTTGKS